MRIWMFWGYFVNNLDFDFKGVGISMGGRDGLLLIRILTVGILVILIVVGKVEIAMVLVWERQG